MEEWKTINGYPDYAISVGGQVKSLRFNRLLTPSLSNNSYLYVNLVENKRKKTTAIHRLVIDHFGPTCPDLKLVVDHKDGNKITLKPSNGKYKPIEVAADKVDVQGVLVGVWRGV